MRILKFILKSFLILALVLAVTALITREVLLILAMQRVASGLKETREIQTTQKYSSECMSKGSNSDGRGAVYQTQLRFIDDNQFAVEVVCNQFELDPIQVSTTELPILVTHQTGQSGLVWGEEASGINLECFGRTASVQIENGVVSRSLSAYVVETGTGPKSQCSSFGYQCCDTKQQKGKGSQLTDVLDCPKTCFESCADRPLILSFNTDPYYDTLSRQLEVSSGQPVTFSYNVSPNQKDSFAGMYQEESDWIERNIYLASKLFSQKNEDDEGVTVTIDFGDGEQASFQTMQAQKQHEYECNRNQCEYTASLNVENKLGIKSISDLHSQIKIKVD